MVESNNIDERVTFWGFCYNCFYLFKTYNTNIKGAYVQCSRCRSQTQNWGREKKDVLGYKRLVICPKCSYLWFTRNPRSRSDAKKLRLIQCPRCKRRIKRSHAIHKFVDVARNQTDALRVAIRKRYPKSYGVLILRLDLLLEDYENLLKNRDIL